MAPEPSYGLNLKRESDTIMSIIIFYTDETDAEVYNILKNYDMAMPK